MSQKRSRKPQCSHDNCGSRRFHVDTDGFTYCDQGHQQSELGTVVAEDTGELVMRGTTSRRQLDSDIESQTSRVSGFTGTKAFEHYLLCLQLILRKQLKWLLDFQGFPGEFETIVRELWALNLHKRRGKASHDSGTDTEAGDSQNFSSQSEVDTDRESINSKRSHNGSRKDQNRNGPNLKDLLSLIYIGNMMLRIPLTIADFHRWITDGELVYYRAAKEVPLSMVDRLPGQYQRLLEPQKLLAQDQLQSCILGVLTSMHTEYGMIVPTLNHLLVLYRWVEELYLPFEVHVAVQRLARLLRIEFAYAIRAEAWSNVSLRCPEIRLMALLIIATKVLFPFDNTKRYTTSASDLAAIKMDWDVWAQVHNESQDTANDDERKNSLAAVNCFTMTGKQTLELAENQLDDYLEWYEHNVASRQVRERGQAGREADFRKYMFRLFPRTNEFDIAHTRPALDSAQHLMGERFRHIQTSLRPNIIAPTAQSDDILRTGSSYVQSKSEDELTGNARLFYVRAAQLAGTSVRRMLKAVFSIERRLMEREKDLRRTDLEQSATSAA